jgi:nicotinamidase-related amidase
MEGIGMIATHVQATTPYAWPYDGDLTGEGTAVLIISPRGAVWPEDATAPVVVAAADVASAVHAAGGVVVSVTTAPPGGGDAPAAPGALPQGKVAVDSVGIDGFYGSALDDTLRSRGITRLILVGYGTETCIHSTMRSANDRGYECLLVSDACLAYDPLLTPHSISMIEMSGGIFGAVGTADAVVAAFTPRSTS